MKSIMAKHKNLRSARRALSLFALAHSIDPNHPWKEPSLEKAARAMVNAATHSSRPNPSTDQKYVGDQPYFGALGNDILTPRFKRLDDILRNAVKCLKCNTVVESKHRHDFVSCSCGNISVDGGLEYLRRVGALKDYEELSEYKDTQTQP